MIDAQGDAQVATLRVVTEKRKTAERREKYQRAFSSENHVLPGVPLSCDCC